VGGASQHGGGIAERPVAIEQMRLDAGRPQLAPLVFALTGAGDRPAVGQQAAGQDASRIAEAETEQAGLSGAHRGHAILSIRALAFRAGSRESIGPGEGGTGPCCATG
jgi:hypothetical protein